MKKIFLLFILFLFISLNVWSQLAVVAPGIEALLGTTYAENAIYYAQSFEQLVYSVQHAYSQLQNAIEMSKLAFNNLRSITQVRSFNDFMDWYNRQLYLERMAEYKYKSLDINIGGRRHKMTDVTDIAYAMKENYVDYWSQEFTPEMRKKMWLDLGLSPSNYAYVQTWKEREIKLLQSIITKRATLNDEYMKDMEINNEIAERINKDKSLPDDDKLQEKDILSRILEVEIRNNKKLNDIAFDNAEAREYEAARHMQEKTLPYRSRLSPDLWDPNKSYFGPITNDVMNE